MNNITNRWLLPEGIHELLPPQSEHLEYLCRKLIDLYQSWGYRLVITPLIEYLDSLLTGTGEDLELQTFKLTDQLSGRTMGVRADITPQVARIDANKIRQDCPTRLCYLGTVLHTRAGNTGENRSPLQVGAELYGHEGIESEAEILCLMLETLSVAGVENNFIDLGHVGIYQILVENADLTTEQETRLFDILQRKSGADLEEFFQSVDQPENIIESIRYIMNASGGLEIIAEAREKLSGITPIIDCLDEIEGLVEKVEHRFPGVNFNVDLTELRGYHYYTGLVFTAYVKDRGQGIAFGGRYNNIGKAFGRSRPATGFSTDVRLLLELSSTEFSPKKGILAPPSDEPALLDFINTLRQQGECVVCGLPGQDGPAVELQCDRQIKKEKGKWVVQDLKKS